MEKIPPTPEKNDFVLNKDKLIRGLAWFVGVIILSALNWIGFTVLDNKVKITTMSAKMDQDEKQWREINKLKDLHMAVIPGRVIN